MPVARFLAALALMGAAAAHAATIVYVANADSQQISVLSLDRASGTLAPIETVEVGGSVMPMVVSADKRMLYAALRSQPYRALSLAIDPASGRLKKLGEASLADSMANIDLDRSGRWLFAASYGGAKITVNAIEKDGRVGAVQQLIATAPNAHAIHADATNRFVLATSLGGGHVMQFRFDVATGALTPNDPPLLAPHPNASARHFVFSRDARFVYLLNELDAKIDVLAFDTAAGTLRTLQTIDAMPVGIGGAPWASDLHLTPDGRFLYASERRSNTLAAFRVDAASGRLALIGHTPTEAQPRGFAITPNGRFLIAAGQVSNRLGVYAIDAQTGALDKRSDCEVGQNPNWIEVVELGD